MLALLQKENIQRGWWCGSCPWYLWLKSELSKDRGFTLSSHTGTALPYVRIFIAIHTMLWAKLSRDLQNLFSHQPNINCWSPGCLDLFHLTLRIWQETCCCIRSGIQSHGNFQRKVFLFLISFFFLSGKDNMEEIKTSCRIMSVCGSVQRKQGNFPREIFSVFLPVWRAPLQPV